MIWLTLFVFSGFVGIKVIFLKNIHLWLTQSSEVCCPGELFCLTVLEVLTRPDRHYRLTRLKIFCFSFFKIFFVFSPPTFSECEVFQDKYWRIRLNDDEFEVLESTFSLPLFLHSILLNKWFSGSSTRFSPLPNRMSPGLIGISPLTCEVWDTGREGWQTGVTLQIKPFSF